MNEVIKWWRRAALGMGVGMTLGAHAGNPSSELEQRIGSALREWRARQAPVAAQIEVKPLEMPVLQTRPAVLPGLLVKSVEGALVVRVVEEVKPAEPKGPAVTDGAAANPAGLTAQKSTGSATNPPIAVLCVSGCEGLFQVAAGAAANAS